jgi:hypothetical protein
MSIKSFVMRSLKVAVPAFVAVGIAVAAPSEAAAQVAIDVGVGIEPPSAYIATAQPEYYEGRPVYYYNNNWYYRDHGRWSYYRHEPVYLSGRRNYWAEHRYPNRVVREPARYRYYRR